MSAPKIITRAEWGADESIRTSGRAFAPIRKLVVHHTASPNNPSNPPGVVRDMYRYHVVDRGYADIGYNFVIDHRGNVYEGRWARSYAPGELHDGEDGNGLGVMAAHAEGVNAGTCGVVLIGDFSSRQPTNAAVNALVQLLAWKASRHQIDPWDSELYTGLFGQTRKFPNIVRPPHRGLHHLPRQRPERQARRHPRLGQGARRELRAQPDRHVEGRPLQEPEPHHARHPARQRRAARCRPARRRPTRSTTAPAATASAVSLGTLLGVRVLSSGGNLTTLGKAQKFGSPAQRGNSATIAITPGPKQSYWTIDAPGNVLAFGGATGFGSLGSTGETSPRRRPRRATAAGTGYWILTKAGGVWAFGSTGWHGSVARSNPGVGAVRMHATASGNGYWILGNDGGIYAYGDATWYGSAAKAGAPDAVDFWPTPTGKGYWVVTASGRVLAFGDAAQQGGMSDLGVKWKQPAVAVVGTPDGRGYHVLSADGGVYSFGAAPFFGSLAGSGKNAVALAPAVV